MEFLLDMLRLNAEERATVEAAMPILASLLEKVDWDMLLAAYAMLVKGQPVANRLIGDLKLLSPVAVKMLNRTGGMFEAMGAMGPAKDVEATVQANQYLVKHLGDYYSKATPLILEVEKEWPKIQPAWDIVLGKLRDRGLVKI